MWPWISVYILIKNRSSSQMVRLSLQEHRCALANCGFAAVFSIPKLTGLLHLGHIEAEGQCYSSPKNGHFEVDRLAIAGCQS
jgi:hypothetical protein